MPNNLSTSDSTLFSHQPYLSSAKLIDIGAIKIGHVIRFNYNDEEKTVYVLDPSWKSQLHGLSMHMIDRRTLMIEVVAKLDLYKTPWDFYTRVVSQNPIQDTGSYRTYDIKKMKNIRILSYQIDERGREEL